ncbi:MAG TPA: lipocalin family protein [Saprospiraceae bacterium]|nr:lipocalin family protein [Saprospiraceae bacterium]HND88941.1 lipocalin family protein [Saprospiraceae bacterium]HNG90503.1 lipocalin family protein [Saprospiraceae bacterium]
MRLLLLLSTLIVSTVYNFFFKSPSDLNAQNANAQVSAKVAKTELSTAQATAKRINAGPQGELGDLTKGAWRIVSITSNKPCDTNGDGIATQDIYSETPACAKDDIMHIRSNGKVTFDRYVHCDLTEKDKETYTWKLGKNGSFLIYDTSIEAKMILKSVTPERLVMDIPMESMGEMFYFTVTYEQVEKP